MTASVSLIIPLYNEAEGIAQLAEKLSPVQAKLTERGGFELILIDDGSTDDTYARLQKAFPSARILRHEKNRNLGAAIRTGAESAKCDWLVFLDSDCTYSPEIVFSLVRQLEEGAGLSTASPYHYLGKVEGVPPYRLFLSRTLSWLYQINLMSSVFTYTAMVRAFPRTLYPRIRSERNDFSAVAEMMIQAILLGVDVREVPTTLRVRRYGTSKMKLLHTIWAHCGLLRMTVRKRWGSTF